MVFVVEYFYLLIEAKIALPWSSSISLRLSYDFPICWHITGSPFQVPHIFREFCLVYIPFMFKTVFSINIKSNKLVLIKLIAQIPNLHYIIFNSWSNLSTNIFFLCHCYHQMCKMMQSEKDRFQRLAKEANIHTAHQLTPAEFSTIQSMLGITNLDTRW